MIKRPEMSEEILLPEKGESVAISTKVKTAALCYDRIWSTSDDVVPKAIRCRGGSSAELGAPGLAADYNIKSNRAPIVALVGPEEKRIEFLKAQTDFGFALLLRTIAKSFSAHHGITMVPIYDSKTVRDRQYNEGACETVVATLANLGIVDEGQLTWEQVIEMRSDEEARSRYKRFTHWLDKEMVGKSQAFVEDEISQRLEDYEWVLKKHGIKAVLGTIEEALDGKYLIGASGIALVADDPILGLLGAGLLIGGRVVVKLIQTKLDFDDIERGSNSEISWVYELKQLGK